MAWIESHQELARHPKTLRLARRLGVSIPAAIGHLQLLWWWAMDFAPDGSLAAFDDAEIADAVMWDGSPDVLIDALQAAKFIDPAASGTGYVIHDWQDYAGRLIERRRQDAERKRTARGRPTDVTAPSGVTVPNRTLTGPDPTGPDLPPNPPPQAEGGLAKTNGKRRRRDPNAVVSVPLTAADEETWREALGFMERGGAQPTLFRGLMSRLEPVARAEDGGLLLRAPPDLRTDAVNYSHVLRRALERVGDAAASRATIVD